MGPMQFQLLPEHIKLLRAASVGWQDAETGAPEINPKRPYGNSSVARDVAEELGWEIGRDGLTDEQFDKAMRLHRETETALQVLLQVAVIVPGLYVNVSKHAPYGTPRYQRVAPTPEVEP